MPFIWNLSSYRGCDYKDSCGYFEVLKSRDLSYSKKHWSEYCGNRNYENCKFLEEHMKAEEDEAMQELEMDPDEPL